MYYMNVDYTIIESFYNLLGKDAPNITLLKGDDGWYNEFYHQKRHMGNWDTNPEYKEYVTYVVFEDKEKKTMHPKEIEFLILKFIEENTDKIKQDISRSVNYVFDKSHSGYSGAFFATNRYCNLDAAFTKGGSSLGFHFEWRDSKLTFMISSVLND